MQKNNPISKIIYTCFSDGLGFRAYIFNTLGFLGIALGIIFGAIAVFMYSDMVMALANFGTSAIAIFIVWHANVTKNFKQYFLITVIVVFIIIFPFLFFTGGGYHSGMPSFFVFAVVFTTVMLEGRWRLFFTAFEILLYLACFLVARHYPQTITPFTNELDMYIDIFFGCIASSVVLAFAIYRHIVVYDRKLKELDESNKQLNSLNRMKIEFLQDISHEMQNPLTTITRGIGFAESHMDNANRTEAVHDALKLAEEEALRLGRMVSGMVKLASTSGGTESREKINFAEMLMNCAETFRLQLDNKNNALHVKIAPGLPFVYGAADQLRQVLINVFINAAKHTSNGEVTIQAFHENGFVAVRVSDTGEGITKELLPNVFERGVSSIGSTGYGLSISRTIMEAHGGEISIESERGKGTTVTFTIPVYGGQSEARGHE